MHDDLIKAVQDAQQAVDEADAEYRRCSDARREAERRVDAALKVLAEAKRELYMTITGKPPKPSLPMAWANGDNT